MDTQELMKRTIKLAMLGNGMVSPNPRVGALIYKDGEVISEGWHKEFGSAHAEVDAIKNAPIDSFEGATLFVNLEPCSHHGKTPPCVDLIIEKKFSKVVVGMIDPNPEVSGNGIQALQNAGIDVTVGVLENECKWINRFFVKYITSSLPYVILKLAQSVDGCVATSRGESKWISSEESRRRSHALRAEVDAVVIGKRTAAIDNPMLTVRSVEGRNPKKIVFDTDLTLPLTINTFKDADRTNTIVCCNPKAVSTRKAETLRLAGIQILPVDINDEGVLNIPSALYALADNNIASIMVEGGSALLSSFIKSQMVDELHLFVAPKVIGNGLNSFGSFKINYLNEAFNFEFDSVSKSGSDIHIIGLKK